MAVSFETDYLIRQNNQSEGERQAVRKGENVN